MMNRRFMFSLFLSVIAGLGIAYMDSSPGWDDTGITVMLVLVVAIGCSLMAGQKPWLIALAVGVWVPLFEIKHLSNAASLMALVPAFIGAYVGYWSTKRIFSH